MALSAPISGPRPLRLSRAAASIRQSVLRDLLARASAPDVLSFAIGAPATDLLPVRELAAASTRLIERGGSPLQYGVPSPALKAHIAALMADRGAPCSPQQIFLCSGAQQGLKLLAALLLDTSDPVLLEETIYDGFPMAVRNLAPRYLPLRTDHRSGLDLEHLERRLRSGSRPAFLYVIAEGHNPLGYSLGVEQRRRLLELARNHALPIVEDDAYGFLHYDAEPVAPLRAAADHAVLYVGSFSKVLGPGLRLGWLVVPAELTPRLSALKHAMDCDTSTYSQHLAAEYLDTGHFPEHLGQIRRHYARRREVLLGALAKHLPTTARWSRPRSGLFVWVELPETVDTLELLEIAIERERLAFAPGQAFGVDGGSAGSNGLRISFANSRPREIEAGVERLARALDRLATAGKRALPRSPAKGASRPSPGLSNHPHRKGIDRCSR